MKSPYLATLEDLATKRRALVGVIVNLAHVAGVDPAPYLAGEGDPEPKKVPPPRPPAPASPTTNGAGPNNKVPSNDLRMRAIAELKKMPDQTLKPGELYRRLKLTGPEGRHLVAVMTSEKQVTVKGNTNQRTVTLA